MTQIEIELESLKTQATALDGVIARRVKGIEKLEADHAEALAKHTAAKADEERQLAELNTLIDKQTAAIAALQN